jgi:hypothetical protein
MIRSAAAALFLALALPSLALAGPARSAVAPGRTISRHATRGARPPAPIANLRPGPARSASARLATPASPAAPLGGISLGAYFELIGSVPGTLAHRFAVETFKYTSIGPSWLAGAPAYSGYKVFDNPRTAGSTIVMFADRSGVALIGGRALPLGADVSAQVAALRQLR